MVSDSTAVPPMQIGEVAARTEMSLRTLRHYDEIGLLSPSARTEGGFRLYTETDLERILVIRRMKPLGYSLEEMAAVMEVIDTLLAAAPEEPMTREARERLSGILKEATQRRQRLEQHLAMADEFIGLLGQHLS